METLSSTDMLRAVIGSAEDGNLFMADVLRWRGGLWLIPTWLESTDGKWRRPARAIRVDSQVQQEVDPATSWNHVHLLLWPVPKAVLDGLTTRAEGVVYEVAEAPEVRVAHAVH
jgi:hypothetical protein